MYPVVVWGGVPLASWYVLVTLAVLASYVYLHYLARVFNYPPITKWIDLLFVGGVTCGWLGARGLSVLVEQMEVTTLYSGIQELFKPGPLTFYGGALAGALFLTAAGALLAIPLRGLVVCASPPLVLGLAIGRLGCWLNGDDYGAPVPTGDSFWTTTFPNLNDGIARYPVQLQESFANIIFLFIFHFATKKNKNRDYFYTLILICSSALNRFFIEFYRGDHRGSFFGTSLSTSQGLAVMIIGITMAAAAVWVIKKRSPLDESTARARGTNA